MTQGWREHIPIRALRERSQSEVLGATLLTGIIVILISTAGLFLFANFDGDEEQLLANIEGDVNAAEITLAHDGGDSFASDEIEIVLSGDTERDLNLSKDFNSSEGSDDEFAPGDTWTYNTSDDLILGSGRILVIHEPTNTVLLDDAYLVQVVPGGIEFRVESWSDSGKQSDQADVYGEGDPSQGDDGVRWNYDVYVDFDDDNPPVKNPDEVNVTFDPESQDTLEHQLADHDLEAYEPDTGTDDAENVTATASVQGFDAEDDVLVSVYPIATLDVNMLDIGSAEDLSTSGFSSLEHTAEIIEGETLAVEFSVVNNEPSPAVNETITLDAGNLGSSSMTIDYLEPGGQETHNLTLETEVGDDGIYDNVTLAGEEDSHTANVTVLELPDFEVTIDGIAAVNNDTIAPGDDFNVSTGIVNTGDLTGTTTLTVDIEGLGQTQTEQFTLDGDGVGSKNFTFNATDPGDFIVNATENTTDGNDTDTVSVLQPAVFDVTLQEKPANNAFKGTYYVEEGDDLQVNATVTNTGDLGGVKTVDLDVPGLGSDSTTLTLGGGESTNETFTVSTGPGDAGNYTATVSSEDDTDSANATVVTDPPDLVATLADVSGQVGDIVDVNLSVFSFDDVDDDIGSYQIVLSYNNATLEFESVEGGDWAAPDSINDLGDAVSVASFSASATTPSEPALTFKFKINGTGTSDIVFDDDVDGVPGENEIRDGSTDPYDVLFLDGAAGTTSSALDTQASTGDARSAPGVSVR